MINKDFLLDQPTLFGVIRVIENLRFCLFRTTLVRGKNNKILLQGNSILRNLKIKVKGDSNIISIGEKCRMRNLIVEIHGHNNRVLLHDKLVFMEAGHILIEGDNCMISIGTGTLFRNIELFAGESKTNIEIGERCYIGVAACTTSDFHSIIDLQTGKRINMPESIKIGRNVWIGNSVIVRKGAQIGDNCVVATNSLVNKKFPESNVILAGLPAKIVRTNITWSREKLQY